MRNEYTDYIQHGHKYVAAIDIGQKAGKKIKRYFYSIPEYQAYLRGKRPKQQEQTSDKTKKPLYNIISNKNKKINNSNNAKLGKTEDEGKWVKDGDGWRKIHPEQQTSDTKKEEKGQRKTSKLKNLAIATSALALAKVVETKNKIDAKVEERKEKQAEKKKEKMYDKDKYKEEIGPTKETKETEEKKEAEVPKFIKDLKAYKRLIDAGFKAKSKETTPDEDCKDINPDWDPDVFKNAYNCAWCTFAFDLRRRGFDVDAGDIDITVENTPDEIKSWYKDAEWSEPMKNSADKFNKELDENMDKYVDIYNKKLKEGWNEYDANTYAASNAAAKMLTEQIVKDANGDKESWGQTIVYWRGDQGKKNAGGHSIAYYQKDGQVTFYDCQTGEKITDITDTLFCTGLVWSGDGETIWYDDFVNCMRTDNKELALDDKKLKRSVEEGDDNPDTSKKNKNKKYYIDQY